MTACCLDQRQRNVYRHSHINRDCGGYSHIRKTGGGSRGQGDGLRELKTMSQINKSRTNSLCTPVINSAAVIRGNRSLSWAFASAKPGLAAGRAGGETAAFH